MLTIRRGSERGRSHHGWLDSRHTFSFAGYYDPSHHGFRSLRVLNDDRVVGGAGFSTHGHRDMEILSFVIEGSLEHRDSLGNGSIIRPGDVQRMTAGRGVTHSEYNASPSEGLRFLQVWIVPSQRGLEPGYEQKHFSAEERDNQFRLVASSDGRDGSLRVHQDVAIYASQLEAGHRLGYAIGDQRHGWLQVVSGSVEVAGHVLVEGDGASLSGPALLELRAEQGAALLLFDLA